MSQRAQRQHALQAFAAQYGLSGATTDRTAIQGTLDGVPISISTVSLGKRRATQFKAFAPSPFPGGLVAYKPNFYFRLPGPRRISDSVAVQGVLSFVHHDSMGDPDIDKKLVVYADDVSLARALLTTPTVKHAILTALDVAGHIRIQDNEVALEIDRWRAGELLESAQGVGSLAFAAVAVVRALCAVAASPYR